MTATRCEEEEKDAADDATKIITDGGYEADTENTLKKKQKKEKSVIMFQPTKFVPRLTQDNGGSPIWKPRNNIL